ncbi:hypothetical protein ACIQW9_06370 [Herminiimonas sp. NPDC097707]
MKQQIWGEEIAANGYPLERVARGKIARGCQKPDSGGARLRCHADIVEK